MAQQEVGRIGGGPAAMEGKCTRIKKKWRCHARYVGYFSSACPMALRPASQIFVEPPGPP